MICCPRRGAIGPGGGRAGGNKVIGGFSAAAGALGERGAEGRSEPWIVADRQEGLVVTAGQARGGMQPALDDELLDLTQGEGAMCRIGDKDTPDGRIDPGKVYRSR